MIEGGAGGAVCGSAVEAAPDLGEAGGPLLSLFRPSSSFAQCGLGFFPGTEDGTQALSIDTTLKTFYYIDLYICVVFCGFVALPLPSLFPSRGRRT